MKLLVDVTEADTEGNEDRKKLKSSQTEKSQNEKKRKVQRHRK